jgi:hypothetical protein
MSDVEFALKGLRFCARGDHQVSVQDCTSEDGLVRQSCRACLERDAGPATRTALQILKADDAAGENSTDDGQFDQHDDLMDLDPPVDTALSGREAALLQNFNQKIGDLSIESCNVCLEDGFNLSAFDGCCLRCRRDSANPVHKWSAGNNVHPGIHFLLVPCRR